MSIGFMPMFAHKYIEAKERKRRKKREDTIDEDG